MELETVNKLYLELSQFATAKTARELELERALMQMVREKDHSRRMMICRSVLSVDDLEVRAP